MLRRDVKHPSPAMVVSLLALFVALGGTAIAAPAFRDPRVDGLQRQVRSLQIQVSALRSQVTEGDRHQQDLTVCYEGLDRDSLNGHWHIINLLAALEGVTPQPDLPRFDDLGACSRIGFAR